VAALGAFYLATGGVERVWGLTIRPQEYNAKPATLQGAYLQQLQSQVQVPSVLFLLAAALTIAMFVVLGRLLPVPLLRTLIGLRMVGKARLRVEGLSHVPTSGPAVIASPAQSFAASLPLVAAVDRRLLVAAVSDQSQEIERVALRSSLVVIRDG